MIWFVIILVGAILYNWIVSRLFVRRNRIAISYPWLWNNILVKIIDYHFSISDRKLYLKLVSAFVAGFGLPSFVVKLSSWGNSELQTSFWSLMFSMDSVDFYTFIAFVILCVILVVLILKNNKNIKHTELQESDIIQRLENQVKFQVQNNIVSGKYLPNTFLEISNVKEQLRCFVDPVVFYEKIRSSLARLNFDFYKRRLTRAGLSEFGFNVSRLPISSRSLDITIQNGTAARAYMESLVSSLNSEKNDNYYLKRKIDRVSVNLSYISAQFSFILGDAGQGKTNFLCDLASNVILKRQIPCIFLNAFELNADTIEQSIAHSIYPLDNIPLSMILKYLNIHCEKTNKPFIIIIDGLNENSQPAALASNLILFITEIEKYSNIRVIFTCRNEYYDIYFKSIESSISANNYVKNTNIYSGLGNQERKILLGRYLKYFNISASLSEEIEKELSEDLLLLRIFSEAFADKHLGSVHTLLYDEMYQLYYDRMSERAVDSLKKVKGTLISKTTIQSFFIKILSLMIHRNEFMGIEMAYIEAEIPEREHDLFHRFIDENLLLRRDIKIANTSLGNTEIISFTYDNFRDYLIADYLVNHISKSDYVLFKKCVDLYTNTGHMLKEGIMAFLFLLSKKKDDISCFQYFRNKEWFDDTFSEYIWQIPSRYITEYDVDDIRRLLVSSPRAIAPKLLYWRRWDTKLNPQINISLLLNYLSSLDDVELKEYLFECWNPIPVRNYIGRSIEKSELGNLIDALHRIIDERRWEQNEDIHYVMEFALYFAVLSPNISRIYKQYLNLNNNLSQLCRVRECCQSRALKQYIDSIKP